MNYTLKIISAFCLFGGVLSSCSSSKTVPYQSKWNAPFNYADQAAPDRQDQQSRLKYGVINDDQYMYITLKARDPLTVKSILGSGLRVSFSLDGGRGSNNSLLFPVVNKDDRRALRNMELDLPNNLSLNRMLEAFNKEAVWKDKMGERFINLITSDSGISCRISMDENQELTQELTIPLARLGADPKQARLVDVTIKTEGSSGLPGGITPRVSIGMGNMGGIGMGGGGVGIGLGNGGRSNANDRTVDIRLQVILARDSFRDDLK
jgi:hypothetical protein